LVVPGGPGLLARAAAVPGIPDQRYLRALKQLAGLNEFDRWVVDFRGMPLALYRDDRYPGENRRMVKGLCAAVSQAAGGAEVRTEELPMSDHNSVHILIYPDPHIYGIAELDQPQWEELYEMLCDDEREPDCYWYGVSPTDDP